MAKVTKYTSFIKPIVRMSALILLPIIGFVLGIQYQSNYSDNHQNIAPTNGKNEVVVITSTPTLITDNLETKARELFIANVLEKGKMPSSPVGTRLTDYTIEKIEIYKDTNNDKLCFSVSYSVKPLDINVDFVAGNGVADKKTGWIKDIFAFVQVNHKDGKYIVDVGTGGACK